MKVLNIDSLVQVQRKVTVGGVSYAIEEIEVQKFIDNLAAAEALEAAPGDPDTLSVSFTKAVTSIQESIPTMPIEVIRKFKLSQMTAVLQFIRGEFNPEAEAAAAAAATSEGADAKKLS